MLLFFILRFSMPDKAGAMGYSWLFAVIFFLSLAVGGLFWTLLHHASNSGWGTVVRRLMENLASLIPFMLILGLPFSSPVSDSVTNSGSGSRSVRPHSITARTRRRRRRPPNISPQSPQKSRRRRRRWTWRRRTSRMSLRPVPDTAFIWSGISRISRRRPTKLAKEDLSDEGAMQTLADKNFQHEASLLFKKRGFPQRGVLVDPPNLLFRGPHRDCLPSPRLVDQA